MTTRISYIAVGILVAGGIVALGLVANRGSHMELAGQILKVRTHGIERAASVAVLDFRFVNPANYPFVVRTVDVFVELKDGRKAEGMVISDIDARRMMEGIPILGPKYNDSLVVRTRIAPRESQDRMISARFEAPVGELDARKGFLIRVLEVDGAVSELAEARR